MRKIKLFEDFSSVSLQKENVASFQNNFKETNSEKERESMIRLYGDDDDYPTELDGIIFIFIGNSDNFAITNDDGTFNVYTWHRMLDGIENIGSFKNVDEAKKMVLSKNR